MVTDDEEGAEGGERRKQYEERGGKNHNAGS
jgi:hypothetical protein